jgi:hypothetical protein
MIEDAARRRRNRQQATFALLAAAALTAVIIGSLVGHRRASRSRLASSATAVPAAIFAQDPYMGVACPTPNSIACDRVGLSVWLARPAIVTATIAGEPLRLDSQYPQPDSNR